MINSSQQLQKPKDKNKQENKLFIAFENFAPQERQPLLPVPNIALEIFYVRGAARTKGREETCE